MTQQSTKPTPQTPLSLRLTPRQKEILKALATRENRSIAGQLRHMIEESETA